MADSELGWFGGQPGSFGGQLMNAVDGAAADAHVLAHGGQGGHECHSDMTVEEGGGAATTPSTTSTAMGSTYVDERHENGERWR